MTAPISASASPRQRLEELIETTIQYPELCRPALEGLVEDVIASTVREGVSLDLDGTFRWQELAVLTRDTLVIWVLTPPDEPEHLPHPSAVVEIQLRIIPLGRVQELSINRAYDPDGVLHGVHATVVLATQDEIVAGHEHTHVLHDTLHFFADEAGSSRLEEVTAFLTALCTQLP